MFSTSTRVLYSNSLAHSFSQNKSRLLGLSHKPENRPEEYKNRHEDSVQEWKMYVLHQKNGFKSHLCNLVTCNLEHVIKISSISISSPLIIWVDKLPSQRTALRINKNEIRKKFFMKCLTHSRFSVNIDTPFQWQSELNLKLYLRNHSISVSNGVYIVHYISD